MSNVKIRPIKVSYVNSNEHKLASMDYPSLVMMIISMFFGQTVKIDRIEIFFGKRQTIAKWSAKKFAEKLKKKFFFWNFIDLLNRSRSKYISIGNEFFRSDRNFDQRSFLPALFWRSDRIIFNEIFSLINGFCSPW